MTFDLNLDTKEAIISNRRLIHSGDVIDWEFLAYQNLDQAFFESISTDSFSGPQWANLFRVNEPIYQELVLEFFASFQLEASACRIARSFGLLTNKMRDSLSVEPPPHIFKKKSLIAMALLWNFKMGYAFGPQHERSRRMRLGKRLKGKPLMWGLVVSLKCTRT
ncbi:hypothetical protein Tco_1120787 [Tanacetum coccineum]